VPDPGDLWSYSQVNLGDPAFANAYRPDPSRSSHCLGVVTGPPEPDKRFTRVVEAVTTTPVASIAFPKRAFSRRSRGVVNTR
jgi:hypothetical protein